MLNLFKLFKNNTKKYKQYISIGYNCENAYRFFNKYHFVESSLFTWTNSINIETLLYALSNLDLIFKNLPQKVYAMWRCPDTNIRFHGKEPHDMAVNFQKYSEEDFKPYQEELVSRITHLKQKFLNQLKDDKKTLITYTYRTDNKEEIKENILKLYNALSNLGGKNFDLLVILERKNSDDYKTNDNIYVRYVDEFAPEEDVTTRHYDKKSWKKIFSEFKADFKLKKLKNFKFEDI